MVHKFTDTHKLGDIFKQARLNAGLTVEELAYRANITPRYLYRLENEGKKPSFDVLYALIRELSIPADLIFYPEKKHNDLEIENLIHQLYLCDNHSLEVVKATANALLETAISKSDSEK